MNLFSKIFLLCYLIVFIACGKRPLAPSIGDNMSFPGSIVSLNSNSFLILNTSANGDYSDGSLQKYLVDSSGNYMLDSVYSIPSHASEVAVSIDSQLLALTFDSSYSETEIRFYDYSNSSKPRFLENLTLNFPNAGGKQTIKRIGFFKRTSDSSYYVYGAIHSFPNDDGSNGNIPPRAFVAQILNNLTSSKVLFTLSYGLNDPNSLAPKVDSIDKLITSTQYTFGYSAPTYDVAHDLFIAFPSGTMGGYNNGLNSYPPLPDALTYFSGASNIKICNNSNCLIQPDYRAVSLAAVDMSSIVSGNPINNSTYFVPLGWNQNGMPYGSITNGNPIKNPNNLLNSDLNSFSFQSGFWTSYWANSLNNGAGSSSCYTSAATSSSNQFSILGNNSLFVVKSGLNGSSDNSNSGGKIGNGNEVFVISGLDILSTNIASIKTNRGINLSGESDFAKISSYQMIDPYNEVVAIKSSWLSQLGTSIQNPGPLTPFIYSRTSNVGSFDTTPTAVGNISVLNFGSNQCYPYWTRNTVVIGALGRDSAWLTSNSVNLSTGTNVTYPYLQTDPTKPSIYSFPAASGARTCTDVFTSTNSPRIFCVNFLTSEISKYIVSQTTPLEFTKY